MTSESIRLLLDCQDGDESAAWTLYERYVKRLVGLARSRLSRKLTARVDAEDVVQSVYRSFFRNAQAGRYELEQSGDLWRLLASITVNKVRDQAKRHTQQKRTVDRESAINDSELPIESFGSLIADEPSPEAAAMLIEEIGQVMTQLDKSQREILELRLQGHIVEDIAAAVHCSERTVRRKLDRIENFLTGRLESGQDES
ncbi:MAG: sigma-70 family RNA polymerase sigma factor [Planctomycetaceae bacterium]